MRAWEIDTSVYFPNAGIELKCAVCKCDVAAHCPKCEISHDIFKTWCRDVWFTLLCGKKRKECVFSTLDTNTLARIYSYCIGHKAIFTDCPLVLLACSHMFHQHCALLWLAKRGACPLCNRRDGVRAFGNTRSIFWQGTLKDCAVYNEPFETRRKRQRRQEHADAQIVHILKKHSAQGGLTRDELLGQVDAGSEENFEAALESVLEREFIFYDDEHNLYTYIP